MSDVLITDSLDGGNITVTRGEIVQAEGPESMVYLSLFGGNEDDSGSENNPLTWWGNLDEPNPAARMVSEFQYQLTQVDPNTQGLRILQAAGLRDLQPVVDMGTADSIEITTTAPQRNRVDVVVTLNLAVGEPLTLTYYIERAARL